MLKQFLEKKITTIIKKYNATSFPASVLYRTALMSFAVIVGFIACIIFAIQQKDAIYLAAAGILLIFYMYYLYESIYPFVNGHVQVINGEVIRAPQQKGILFMASGKSSAQYIFIKKDNLIYQTRTWGRTKFFPGQKVSLYYSKNNPPVNNGGTYFINSLTVELQASE